MAARLSQILEGCSPMCMLPLPPQVLGFSVTGATSTGRRGSLLDAAYLADALPASSCHCQSHEKTTAC